MKAVYLIPAPDMSESAIAAIQVEGCEIFPLRLASLENNATVETSIQFLKLQIRHEKPILLGFCYGGMDTECLLNPAW